jgi:hypothetical protein
VKPRISTPAEAATKPLFKRIIRKILEKKPPSNQPRAGRNPHRRLEGVRDKVLAPTDVCIA